ncbi:hypothetical protein BDK51DRAFT_25847 [Blyttiomyces helicus]|uniref:FCH domain-containing protein n=1 Tax=Blyttiomyces helicus TaxID=388810 RepID=A0A4P9W3P7_9FUNG|nr:hypothetical protein BDK51DRAFT_25847 [Blyttiomyces helicus]|eukprot:RKO84766.1 hypothetical protein BDK51DRAFT_25847 [Blyttiomyces helicus]
MVGVFDNKPPAEDVLAFNTFMEPKERQLDSLLYYYKRRHDLEAAYEYGLTQLALDMTKTDWEKSANDSGIVSTVAPGWSALKTITNTIALEHRRLKDCFFAGQRDLVQAKKKHDTLLTDLRRLLEEKEKVYNNLRKKEIPKVGTRLFWNDSDCAGGTGESVEFPVRNYLLETDQKTIGTNRRDAYVKAHTEASEDHKDKNKRRNPGWAKSSTICGVNVAPWRVGEQTAARVAKVASADLAYRRGIEEAERARDDVLAAREDVKHKCISTLELDRYEVTKSVWTLYSKSEKSTLDAMIKVLRNLRLGGQWNRASGSRIVPATEDLSATIVTVNCNLDLDNLEHGFKSVWPEVPHVEYENALYKTSKGVTGSGSSPHGASPPFLSRRRLPIGDCSVIT